jgi:uncharacterized protein
MRLENEWGQGSDPRRTVPRTRRKGTIKCVIIIFGAQNPWRRGAAWIRVLPALSLDRFWRWYKYSVVSAPRPYDILAAKGFYLLHIFVDADACPVKQEVYRVAKRYVLKVTLVSNSRMRTPHEDWLEAVVVAGHFDAADDWIVEHVNESDIVISGDVPLASRCLGKGAQVLAPTGRVFTEDSIGEALASREFLSYLRDFGTITRGPAPFEKRDRSRFLQRLDETIQAVRGRKQQTLKVE